MFDLSDRPLVWVPVKWSVLRPGRGAKATAIPTDVTIKVEVELLDREQLAEFYPEIVGESLPVVEDETPQEARTRHMDAEVSRFMRVVNAWSGVKNGTADVELSEDVVRQMMLRPGFSIAFDKAFIAACAGKLETRRGN